MIKTVSGDQQQILQDAVHLHCGGRVDLDPTYSKGVFYQAPKA